MLSAQALSNFVHVPLYQQFFSFMGINYVSDFINCKSNISVQAGSRFCFLLCLVVSIIRCFFNFL